MPDGTRACLEAGLECAMQRAYRNLGTAAAVAWDLDKGHLAEDLYSTKLAVQQWLVEFQARQLRPRIRGQLELVEDKRYAGRTWSSTPDAG